MKRFIKSLAVATAMALALAGCGADDGGEGASGGASDNKVTVGIVKLAIFAPIFVADAKGYFEDEGLDVEIQGVKSGQDAVPLAASGQIDVAAVGFSAGMFSAVNTGLEVKTVASMGVSDGDTDKSPTNLVVAPGKAQEITDIAALKGKKVAVLAGKGGTGAYLLGIALESAGLSINDVELVNLSNPDMPAALQNGSVDAALVAAPFNKEAIDSGAVSLAVPPKGTSGTGVLYGDKFRENPNAQKFFNAMVKASKDLQGEERYSDEHIQILAEALDQDPGKMKETPLYTWNPDLAPLPDQMQAMERIWMETGAIEYTDPQPVESYIDDTFAKNAP